jgi:hypothetical protein
VFPFSTIRCSICCTAFGAADATGSASKNRSESGKVRIKAQEALEKLRQYFTRLDAKRAPVSDEEAEEIINEALRSTRPNYRPIG